jgi:hypothetical protein
LVVDRSNLRLQVGSGNAFPDDLPAVLKFAAFIAKGVRWSLQKEKKKT